MDKGHMIIDSSKDDRGYAVFTQFCGLLNQEGAVLYIEFFRETYNVCRFCDQVHGFGFAQQVFTTVFHLIEPFVSITFLHKHVVGQKIDGFF